MQLSVLADATVSMFRDGALNFCLVIMKRHIPHPPRHRNLTPPKSIQIHYSSYYLFSSHDEGHLVDAGTAEAQVLADLECLLAQLTG